MNFVNKFVAVAILLALTPAVHAGAVEDIQAKVKESCGGKDISSADALKLVKALLKTCADGEMVDAADGCKVKCMKSGGGDVVGGK